MLSLSASLAHSNSYLRDYNPLKCLLHLSRLLHYVRGAFTLTVKAGKGETSTTALVGT